MDPEARRVIQLALARPALPGGGRTVCVDGPAGSGKTTLAAALVEAFDGHVEVVHMDDVYDGWRGLGDSLARRLRQQVTAPFASGAPGSYRRYDWDRGSFAELHVVPPAELLVLEGVGSGHRLLAEHRTVLIWISAPDEIRVARGMARDRELYGRAGESWDDAAQRRHWEGFLADESRHFAENDLPAVADVRVDGARKL